MASPFAIDGDLKTHWGGPFAGEHWLQVDLSRVGKVGGVIIQWDSGFAASYRILASVDGESWQTAYETTDGQGGTDYVFFPSVDARYMRLASVPLSADWGVSVFEFEPLGADEAPQISGLGKVDAETVWGGVSTPARPLAAQQVTIKLPRPLPTTGLEVFWGGPGRSARLSGREADGSWRTLANDPEALTVSSLLAARKPITAAELRLQVAASRGGARAIRRLRLLPADRTMTPLRRYEVAASRAHRELFPPNTRNQQVYWTTIGIPAGRQKSIFDEFGNLEAWKGAPMVQPLWRDANRRVHAAHGARPTQTLRESWMPMPAVEWAPQEGLLVRSEAIAIEQGEQPVTLLRHRLQNTGEQPISGQLTLLMRPVQINPPWQSGGVSPMDDVAIEGTAADTAVRINGRLFAHSLSPVQASGAASFGTHGEGELTHAVVTGPMPTTPKAVDYDGLAAAYLRYAVQLAPGQKQDVVLVFPLGTERIDVLSGKFPEAPPIDRAALMGQAEDAGAAFDAVASQVAGQWQALIGGFSLVLPDRSLVDLLRAQVAYMLLNQTGPAIQPGPRNYNRSFIRDGSATAAVLMRMGLPRPAREYLRWFADHAVHKNGLVSPILGEDGSVDRGFGSDLEYDSQGEFVSLVADVARLDGGVQTVREYLPKVRLALHFIEQLRARTLVQNYQHEKEAPERFRGILAPSISHEGYSVPTHSYWDDYWALKGLHDGAWLAAALGDTDLDKWARSQYAVLHESVAASIRATMAWKRVEYVPSSADLGDLDPTGTSIALDPCGVADVLPEAAVQFTFDNYMKKIRNRAASKDTWDFTPYELRNVLTFVRLNRPADANELLLDQLRYRRPLAWQMFAEVVHSRLRHPGYFGDMPHTWIGTELVRAVIGMLMHDGDAALELLPGTPPAWLAGDGLRVSELRTAYGHLSMTVRQEGARLRITLGPNLAPNVAVQVMWPSRKKPNQVWVDGQPRTNQTSDGILIERPFHELVAQW